MPVRELPWTGVRFSAPPPKTTGCRKAAFIFGGGAENRTLCRARALRKQASGLFLASARRAPQRPERVRTAPQARDADSPRKLRPGSPPQVERGWHPLCRENRTLCRARRSCSFVTRSIVRPPSRGEGGSAARSPRLGDSSGFPGSMPGNPPSGQRWPRLRQQCRARREGIPTGRIAKR